MSLLQDALRKAQKGHGGAAAPGGSPLPGRDGPAKAGKRKLWAGLAIAAVFLAGAAVLLLVRSSPESSQVVPQPAATASSPEALAPSPAVSAPASAAAKLQSRAYARPAAKAQAGDVPLPPPAPGAVRRSPQAGTAGAEPESGAGSPPSLSAPLSMAAPQPAPVPPPDGRASQVARFNEGVAAQARGDWEAAERLFREVVSKEPSIVEGWNSLGNALLRLGKLSDADRALRKALSLDPNYPGALMNAGLLRLQDGRAAEAAACFARASSLDPRSPSPRVNLAIAQARLGSLAEAEETLAGARRAFPSNPDILYHLGTVYERTGSRDKAREAYSSFLDASAGRRPGQERLVRDRLKELH